MTTITSMPVKDLMYRGERYAFGVVMHIVRDTEVISSGAKWCTQWKVYMKERGAQANINIRASCRDMGRL